MDRTGADELKLGFWKIADVLLLLLLLDSEKEAWRFDGAACVGAGAAGAGTSGRSFSPFTSLEPVTKDIDIREEDGSKVRGGREGMMGPDSEVFPCCEECELCRCRPSI